MKLTSEDRRERLRETIRRARMHGCYELKVVPNTMYMRGRCIHCGKDVEREHSWFRSRCLCQRRIVSARQGRRNKKAHRDFFQEARSRNIRILYWPGRFQAKAKFECRVCKNHWEANANNVRRGSGCPECYRQKISGDGCHLHRPDVRRKVRRTMMRKYGVYHALQNRELFDKAFRSGYRHYDYDLAGKSLRVQGYEPYALDWLVSEAGIDPKSIVAGRGRDVPTVRYNFRGKTHVYHPDIYIPKRKFLIEVKSWYTYRCSTERNLAKRRAAKKAGFKFMFLVMNRDGTRRDVDSNPSRRTRRIRRPSVEKDSRRRCASF